MPYYNTRTSAPRYQDENVIVSPSATGLGIHIRWHHKPKPISIPSAVVQLSHHDSSDSEDSSPPGPITPQDSFSDPQDNEVGCPNNSQKNSMSTSTVREEEIAREGLMALRTDKALAEESMKHHWEQGEEYSDEEMLEEMNETDDQGSRLPKGIKGLGPEGTFLISDRWHPRPSEHDPATTDQLPSINEDAEVMDLDQDDASTSISRPEFVHGSSGVRDSSRVDVVSTTVFGGLPEFVMGA